MGGTCDSLRTVKVIVIIVIPAVLCDYCADNEQACEDAVKADVAEALGVLVSQVAVDLSCFTTSALQLGDRPFVARAAGQSLSVKVTISVGSEQEAKAVNDDFETNLESGGLAFSNLDTAVPPTGRTDPFASV